MEKLKPIVFSILIGAFFGYLILSPISMLISDHVHSYLPLEQNAHTHSSYWISLTEPFQPKFKLWAFWYTCVGALIGYVTGFLLNRVKKEHGLLIVDQEKRIHALEQFRKETKCWEEDVIELKAEVNNLLLQQGKDKKY